MENKPKQQLEAEEKVKKKAKSFLTRIKSLFAAKRKIIRIRVISGTQAFWVKNPKKIKFWKGLAESQGGFSLRSGRDLTKPVQITMVEYK
ncbi:hypothetical protein LCGC14_2432440 [marine sediment metagenome]|uniref:Uncharacterized protein n=1 Tax=marine sediment metagenome TaxID=412755 RepID=A0A0F8XIG4_9ZZZZ